MSLVLECETPPLHEDKTGAIRVGNSRVLLETVIRAFQDGASAWSCKARSHFRHNLKKQRSQFQI